MEFNVHIDDATWAKIRSGDAFMSDEHEKALAAILALSIETTGKVKTTSELMLITGKIKVKRIVQPRP